MATIINARVKLLIGTEEEVRQGLIVRQKGYATDTDKWIIRTSLTEYREISGSEGVEEAPLDGKTYGRKDAGWVEAEGLHGYLRGYDDREDPSYKYGIQFILDPLDGKFKVTHTSGTVKFYTYNTHYSFENGDPKLEYTPAGISDESYAYFDNTGQLVETAASLFNLGRYVCIAGKYAWDDAIPDGGGGFISTEIATIRERHSAFEAPGVREGLHFSKGTVWGRQGADWVGLAQGDTTAGISSGIFFDEDVRFDGTAQPDGGAIYPKLAFQGVNASGNPKLTRPSLTENFALFAEEVGLTPTGRAVYNPLNGGTGEYELQPISGTNQFFWVHVYAANGSSGITYTIGLGAVEYNTRISARSGVVAEVKNIQQNSLTAQEAKLCYSLLLNGNGELEIADTADNSLYKDWRDLVVGGGGEGTPVVTWQDTLTQGERASRFPYLDKTAAEIAAEAATDPKVMINADRLDEKVNGSGMQLGVFDSNGNLVGNENIQWSGASFDVNRDTTGVMAKFGDLSNSDRITLARQATFAAIYYFKTNVNADLVLGSNSDINHPKVKGATGVLELPNGGTSGESIATNRANPDNLAKIESVEEIVDDKVSGSNTQVGVFDANGNLVGYAGLIYNNNLLQLKNTTTDERYVVSVGNEGECRIYFQDQVAGEFRQIGIGGSSSGLNTGLLINPDDTIHAPAMSVADIKSAVDSALTTKEYVESVSTEWQDIKPGFFTSVPAGITIDNTNTSVFYNPLTKRVKISLRMTSASAGTNTTIGDIPAQYAPTYLEYFVWAKELDGNAYAGYLEDSANRAVRIQGSYFDADTYYMSVEYSII